MGEVTGYLIYIESRRMHFNGLTKPLIVRYAVMRRPKAAGYFSETETGYTQTQGMQRSQNGIQWRDQWCRISREINNIKLSLSSTASEQICMTCIHFWLNWRYLPLNQAPLEAKSTQSCSPICCYTFSHISPTSSLALLALSHEKNSINSIFMSGETGDMGTSPKKQLTLEKLKSYVSK